MEITEANNRLYVPEDQGLYTSRNFLYRKAGARPVILMVKKVVDVQIHFC